MLVCCSVKGTIDRYKKASSDNSGAGSAAEANAQNELLFAEIEFMQKREVELHNNNQYLRAKIAENERAQQSMSLMPGGSSEYELAPPPQSFDSRNYFQVNALQPNNNHYSRQDQTALQLN
ncbi:hypothetical protein KSS87_016805 [Heliosperma pusillum]|nr:hypothetical protein KSS87_016805 [Heliosperma pusillum]